jgi:hypothetical protein
MKVFYGISEPDWTSMTAPGLKPGNCAYTDTVEDLQASVSPALKEYDRPSSVFSSPFAVNFVKFSVPLLLVIS